MQLLQTTPESDQRPSAAAVEVRYVNPLEGPEWDRLVSSHPGATVFHSAAWAKVLIRTYGHRPLYFALYQAGRLTALVPLMEVRSMITGRRGVCLPFSDSCAPLCFGNGGATAEIAGILDSLAAGRGWRHWEIRGGSKPEPGATPSASFYGHTLDLRSGPDSLFSRFEPAVRRAIRKAENANLTVAVRSDPQAMLEYFGLHVRTRRRHGLPPQPLAFFRNIYEEIIRTGLGSVVMASKNAQPLAGAVFLHSGDRALYKFGASDERFLDLRANNLVMWTGIQAMSAGGYATLDFGRTSRSQYGLRHFKQCWGTLESTIHYYRSGSRPAPETAADRTTGRHTVVFSRLPLGFNRLLGTLIYPHLD